MQCDQAGNPILDQFSEDGFVDLTFRIHDLTLDAEYYHFHMAASHAGEVVGMNVVLLRDIQGGLDADMHLIQEHVYRKGVRLLRSGTESDRLLAAISSLYGFADAPKKMVEEETFTAIALHQGHLNLDSQGVKIKLFGKDAEPLDEDAITSPSSM